MKKPAVHVGFLIPVEHLEKLKGIAAREHRSVSHLLRYLVWQEICRDEAGREREECWPYVFLP